MRTRWPALALTLALPSLPGCFGTHDTGDAGGGVDAGPDAAPRCRSATISELRATRVLLEDQPLVVTVRAPSDGGCGCEPTLGSLAPPMASIAPLLCWCCDVCDCIDPGYEISEVGATWPPGEHELVTSTGESRRLLVTTRDRTFPIEPTALRIEPPDITRRRSGHLVHWVQLTTVISVCCVEPVVAVDEGIGPAGEIVLTLRNAVQEDCACVGDPVELDVWWPLVDLPSGEHVVRAGTLETTVLVPEGRGR